MDNYNLYLDSRLIDVIERKNIIYEYIQLYTIMPGNDLNKLCMVLIYSIVIILVPIFLDYLFKLSVRRKRKLNILQLAESRSKTSGKPLLIIDSINHATISKGSDSSDSSKEEINDNVTEYLGLLKENSFVVVVLGTLEYIPNLKKFIEELNFVSGHDLYIANFEKNSPRIFYDYKIKNIMDEPFYTFTKTNKSNKEIMWSEPTSVQKNTQNFYFYVLKIVPYHWASSGL
jgi:hypothetical protein